MARISDVEGILSGQIHCFMQLRFGRTMLVTAPSTTTANALRLCTDAGLALFVEPPAMLLHHWLPRTGLIIHHVRTGLLRGPLPFF